MRDVQKIVLVFFSILLVECAERDTFTGIGIDPTIGGNYTKINGTVSGNLIKAESPYLIESDLIVEANKVLIIEPGVELFFRLDVQLIVRGRIDAIGTANSMIRFTAFGSDWAGIHLLSPNDNSTFSFCIIELIYHPQASQFEKGALEISDGAATISNCIFQYNYTKFGGGIAGVDSDINLSNSTFYRNEAVVYGGAVFLQNCTAQLINNTFYRNFSLNFGGGVVIDEPINIELQNNIFYNNFSFLGDPRIELVNGDSTNIFKQFNYLAFGEMNPLFISETNYHLQQNSPCIDAGNPSSEFNDADGTRNDQGAYGGPNGNW